MSIESMIGIAYCFVAMAFLVGKVVMRHRQKNYSDHEPEELITVFVWPLLIVLWMIQRKAK